MSLQWRELTFFLGLQVKQKPDGIFISQDKYVAEILKKFDFASVKTASTPIETQKPLVKDEEVSDVDVTSSIVKDWLLNICDASSLSIMLQFVLGSRLHVTPKDLSFECCQKILGTLKREINNRRLFISWQRDMRSLIGNAKSKLLWPLQQQKVNSSQLQAARGQDEANRCVFHEVIDFLRRSYIYHALTVSPVVSTTFVEQFWTSAKSKTINNVRHITAKVAGKDSLPNQAIFNAIQLMGYEGDLTVLTFNKALFSPQWRHLEAKKKFVMYPRFISIFLDRQLANISVPLDHFPVNSLTSKVFSFMIKRGKHFSGKVTPLFDTMLVQPTQDEGASSERLSVEQPSPSHSPTGENPNESLPDSSSAQPSEVPFEHQPSPSPRPSPRPSPTPIVPHSIPEPTGENLGDHSSNDTSLSGNEDEMTLQNVYDLCISLCQQVSDQAKEIKLLKAKITKLKDAS
ncbi:uncharacterized mitochondrial protein-like protein [Tanacetum coccineum]